MSIPGSYLLLKHIILWLYYALFPAIKVSPGDEKICFEQHNCLNEKSSEQLNAIKNILKPHYDLSSKLKAFNDVMWQKQMLESSWCPIKLLFSNLRCGRRRYLWPSTANTKKKCKILPILQHSRSRSCRNIVKREFVINFRCSGIFWYNVCFSLLRGK